MNEQQFNELLASVREGGSILRGDKPPSRSFKIAPTDIKGIRDRYGLSQERFARLLGISAATLRNWEQGRRHPDGPARVLLRIAEDHPEAVLRAAMTAEHGGFER